MKILTTISLLMALLCVFFVLQKSTRGQSSSHFQALSDGVHEAWVRHYASGLDPSNDIATAIVVDDTGNVYVAGYGSNLPFGVDYFTVKYDTAGTQAWIARYNGPDNEADLALAISVDAFGNVYVAGRSWDSGTNYDYATIKYNNAGVEQWVARYNGPGNSFDEATALAVDPMGNVYVTGTSGTIKYNHAGVQEWTAAERATALAVDTTGNVYVTGGSGTIKYDSAGVKQWLVNYDGITTALAVDDALNVYVTGTSGGGLDADYATVKYNTAGVEQWVAHYNTPPPGQSRDVAVALAVDTAGNVYVTGESYVLSRDYTTVKYNSAGAEQWVAIYNSSGNVDEVPTALAVDKTGNVYVAGNRGTVKYNKAGAQEWVAGYGASALAVNDSGNVYVTGTVRSVSTGDDCATTKYNPAGVEQWVAYYNGPGNSFDAATAFAVDASGNVYVTGKSRGAETVNDYATIKYNSAGVEQWFARYNGPGNLSRDVPAALAVDAAGNVYVAGTSSDVTGTDFYATVKYNSAGVQDWVAHYDGPDKPPFSFDSAIAIAVDAVGNVYVTGTSRDTLDDYATVKYNSAGVEQWVARYNGPRNSHDAATALAVDDSGNVYVTGKSRASLTTDDYATVKYNSAGVEQWVARYNGPTGNFQDAATALAVDDSGNVYVTGNSAAIGTMNDYATIKYNRAGVEQWSARYNGPGMMFNSNDDATALAIDDSGNVYVTGTSQGLNTDWDYATVKYNRAGIQQWVARYNGPANSFDTAIALAVDVEGNVYLTGTSKGLDTCDDYTTVKYNRAGVEQWVAHYNGPANSCDAAIALVVDASSNVYVTGQSARSSWSIYTTIKYVQTPVSVEEKETVKPNGYWLSQNYPNPFNPTATIRYSMPQSGHVTLKMFNLQGQEIAALVNENKPAGEHEIQWNPTNVSSGGYVYKLKAGEFVETKKLVLLK
jgi:uncharacterized delta-60 repeat protein